MQEETERRSNIARSEATRTALLRAARSLFVEKGYAETGTPELVAAAGVTRGALYHHFEDKRAVYLALVEAEAAVVAAEIEASCAPGGTAAEMLHKGSIAFLDAMQQHGRTRLMLIEAPAVLGIDAIDAIDRRNGRRTLRDGLLGALGEDTPALDAIVELLSAAFERAAIAITRGVERADIELALHRLIDGLLAGKGG